MEEVESHYCYGEGSHPDGCDCQCDTCIRRRKELQREAFNQRLSDRIKETSTLK